MKKVSRVVLIILGVILFIGGVLVTGFLDYNRSEFSELKFFIANIKTLVPAYIAIFAGIVLVGLGITEGDK